MSFSPSELDALKQIRIERRLKQLSFQRELDALQPAKPIIQSIESDNYKEDNAHFWIDSIPQRARIWINGINVGDLTPAKKAGYYLEPGTYTFELVLKNHLLWSETVTLAKEDSWSETIFLEKRANLKINSDPERARIWLDGIRLSDLTPAKKAGYFLDPGEHVVKLEKTGYPMHIETLDLAEGEEWNETITLGVLGIDFSNWSDLKPKLEDGTVGNVWWNISEDDRRTIAELAIKNTLFYVVRHGRSGKTNCEGGEGDVKKIICLQNVLIRCLKFGSDIPSGGDACYYRRSATSEEFCYIPDINYNLPCYAVTCMAHSGGFGHGMCAIQVNENIEELDSFIVFQYSSFDIKPGHWQMPVDEYPGDMHVEITVIKSLTCTGFCSDELMRWEF